VTVAPTQIIAGATGSAVRGWTEALLQGPLDHAGLRERADEAQRLRDDGDATAAAEGFEAVAEALVEAGYAQAADIYLERAARAYAEGPDRERARDLHLRLARAALGDGSLDGQEHARRARELSAAESAWEADALLAAASWPERQEGDFEAIRRAWDETRGTDAEVEWAARFVELALLTGERREEAVEIASATRDRHALAKGDRLYLELDYLDLLEADHERVDSAWGELVNFLTDPRLPVYVAGTAYQRRGVALARRGSAPESRSAFLQAVAQWARLPGFDDQAAEAYFSASSALLLLGDMTAASDRDAASLARTLRGPELTETAKTERLLRQGMRALVNEDFPKAFRTLSVAMSTARRAGNLSDFLEAAEALGDCLRATVKHRGAALQAYVVAGRTKKAKQLTDGESVDDVLSVVSLHGPRWERAAAWAAVAGCGHHLSDEAAFTIADAALAEIEEEPAGGFPANAGYYALETLAHAICAVPPARRDQALDLLRQRYAVGLGKPNDLPAPFQEVTRAGIADETETLVEGLIESPLQRPRGAEVVDVLDRNTDAYARVLAAARDGHAEALKAVAFLDSLHEDADALAQAANKVEAVIDAPLRREVSQEGGTRTVSYGVGESLAAEGIYARHCPENTRARLVAKLLETLAATDLPLMTRVGAAEALLNMAPAIPAGLVEDVVRALGSLALMDDVLAEVDRLGADEPLGAWVANPNWPG